MPPLVSLHQSLCAYFNNKAKNTPCRRRHATSFGHILAWAYLLKGRRQAVVDLPLRRLLSPKTRGIFRQKTTTNIL